MRRKKKSRIASSQPMQGQLDHMSLGTLQAIIQKELNKLSSPVEHLDPATIDFAALDVSIAQAQHKNRRR